MPHHSIQAAQNLRCVPRILADGPWPDLALTKERARILGRDKLRRARLVTSDSSDTSSEPSLLLLDPVDGDIFLRPTQSSPTVALIEYGFPSFARGLIGRVQVTHKAVAPLEFALALTLNATSVEWSGEKPTDCLAFSGWVQADEAFQLRDVGLSLPDLTSSALHILLGIRSPGGAGPLPAGSFWREFALVWDV